MIELETPRLCIRNGARVRPTPSEIESDYQRYVVEHEDPETTLSQYEDEITFAFLNAKRGSIFGYYNAYPKGVSKWIGHCSLYPLLCQPEIRNIINHEKRKSLFSSLEFEIGWAISKDYRNQGYATEGAMALLNYCFGELHVNRVVALTDRENTPSIRVMEKLDMTLLEIPSTGGIIGMATNASH